MQISEVLTIKGNPDTLGIEPDAPVAEAVQRMVDNDIGSLVVKQGDTLVGFITERDIMRGLYKRDCKLEEVKVSELMEMEPVVASLDDSVDYARDVMTKSHVSHLVVLNGSQLAGVISFYDVAKACLKEANFENSMLKRYIKHWPE